MFTVLICTGNSTHTAAHQLEIEVDRLCFRCRSLHITATCTNQRQFCQEDRCVLSSLVNNNILALCIILFGEGNCGIGCSHSHLAQAVISICHQCIYCTCRPLRCRDRIGSNGCTVCCLCNIHRVCQCILACLRHADLQCCPFCTVLSTQGKTITATVCQICRVCGIHIGPVQRICCVGFVQLCLNAANCRTAGTKPAVIALITRRVVERDLVLKGSRGISVCKCRRNYE